KQQREHRERARQAEVVAEIRTGFVETAAADEPGDDDDQRDDGPNDAHGHSVARARRRGRRYVRGDSMRVMRHIFIGMWSALSGLPGRISAGVAGIGKGRSHEQAKSPDQWRGVCNTPDERHPRSINAESHRVSYLNKQREHGANVNVDPTSVLRTVPCAAVAGALVLRAASPAG